MLSMNDVAMETVECQCIDSWCMLDWIIGLCHKTAVGILLIVLDITRSCEN